MTAAEVLRELDLLGAKLEVRGGRLWCPVPACRLPPELRGAMAALRAELLALLASPEPAPLVFPNTDPEDPSEPRTPLSLPPIATVRRIVAGWPIPLRERWGRRANELADQGGPHPLDEQQAYIEILAEPTGAELPAPLSPPEVEPRATRVPREKQTAWDWGPIG
jgi:hypothetical protein